MKQLLSLLLVTTLLSNCYREPLANWQGTIGADTLTLNHPEGEYQFPAELTINYQNGSKEYFGYTKEIGLQLWIRTQNDTTYVYGRNKDRYYRNSPAAKEVIDCNYELMREQFHDAEDRCEAWLDSIAKRQ